MTTPNPYGSPAPGAYPQPGYAPAPGSPATLGRRAAAYAIDAVVVALAIGVWVVLGLLVARAVGEIVVMILFSAIAWLLAIAWFFVYSALQGGHGSIGMRLMKLQLVRLETGAPLGFGGALLRNLIWGLAGAIVVGFFSVLFDRSGLKQGWHDKVAHAYMRTASPTGAGAAPGPTASVAPVSPVAPAYGGAGSAFPTYTGAVPEPVAPAAATVQPAPAAPVPPAASYDGAPHTGAPYAGASYTGVVPPRPPLPERPLAPATPAPSAVAPAPAPQGDGVIAFVPGITQDPPSVAPASAAPTAPASPATTPATTPVSPPAPVSPPEEDIDGDTVLVRPVPAPVEPEPDLEDTRLVSRRRPALLEWDDSTRHTVAARAFFGRNPQAPEGAEAVVVRDETLSLSKTHFEIVVDDASVSVIDQHSTNGVVVVRAGERITAVAGEAVTLHDGDALEIGDRIVTFQGRG